MKSLMSACWNTSHRNPERQVDRRAMSMTLAPVSRWLRTVRHLRWSQIARRVERNSRRRCRWFAPSRSSAANVTRDDCAPRGGLPDVPRLHGSRMAGERLVELLRNGQFRHLNQTEMIGYDSPAWRLGPQHVSRLWTMTLHYHAWADELAAVVRSEGLLAAEAESLLEHYLGDWLRRCDLDAAGAEDLAWNPYAIATRLSNWIRLDRSLGAAFFDSRPAFTAAFLSSMWRQARHLHANLEVDLRGNHLLRDAVGLAWAGRFFRGSEPQQWLQTATRLAVQQMREQVLTDGGHFERSPHYHVEVMHDLLSLALLLEDADAAAEIRRAWAAMAEYIAWLRHPNGFSPQFNDAAGCQPDGVLNLGKHLGLRIDPALRRGGRFFSDTGVVACLSSPWTVFFDVGEIGPDYQPGHAHADTLTLECSLAGQRLFVDPGCHSYDHNERRHYDRSTAAHNTVCIDGVDSSEIWHIFRVGRRARPRDVQVDFTAGGMRASASHSGYEHLPGSPRHARTVTGQDNGCLEIVDTIEGRGTHTAQGGLLLAPEWHAEAVPGGWIVTRGNIRARVHIAADQAIVLSLQRCPIHAEYGLEDQTNRLCWASCGALPLQVTARVEPLGCATNGV